MSKLRKGLTYSNVIATIALFLALGGGAYAALKLPKNSVGGKQIKANAVNSGKVRDGSLRRTDFGSGQIPAGPAGPAGPQGLQGIQGPAGAQGDLAGFARIDPDGTLHNVANDPGFENPPAQQENVAQANIQHPSAGTYCFGGLSFTPKTAMVALDNGQVSPLTSANKVVSVGVQRGAGLSGCDTGFEQARVNIVESDDTPQLVDHQFYIWFED